MSAGPTPDPDFRTSKAPSMVSTLTVVTEIARGS